MKLFYNTTSETKLARTSEVFTQIKNIIVSITIVLLILIITHFIIRETKKKYIIVDSIEVPQLLVQKGYTGNVVAMYLIDEMNRINYVAEDSTTYTLNPQGDRPTIGISKDMADLNFQIPETEISFSSIVNFFRIYFNKKPITISGDIIVDDDIVNIHFRYGEIVIRHVTTLDKINNGLKYVALEMLKIIRPVTVANYFYSKNNFEEAKTLLKNNLPKFSSLDKSEALLILGLIEYNKQRRDTAKATVYFNMSIRENNYNAASNNSLGLLRRIQKKDTLAEKCFLNAIKANRDFASAYVNLGILRKENGDTVKAIYYFNEAIKRNYANSSYAHINLGIVHKFNRNFVEAEKVFQQAIDIAPLHADGYINLGLLKRDQGSLSEAEEVYNQALKISPNDYFIHNVLGILKRDQGFYGEADSLFEKAILLQPNSPAYGYNNIGHIRRDEGSNTEAILMYNNSCIKNPFAPNSFAFLGLIEAGKGNKGRAKYLYEKAIKIDKNGANAYTYMALLNEIVNYEQSIDLCKKSIKINPAFVDAYVCLSIIYKSRKNSLLAKKFHNIAIAISPINTAYAYMSFGNLRRDQRAYDKAVEMYSNAIEINEKCVYGWINIIRILRIEKLNEEARVQCTEALKVNPNNRAILTLEKLLRNSSEKSNRKKTKYL